MTEFQPAVLCQANKWSQRQRIAAAFGRSASHYDDFAHLQRQVADHLHALVSPQMQPGAVLDLGCGTGYGSAHVQAKFPHAHRIAIDLALPMLQQLAASSSLRKPESGQAPLLLCADAQTLPLANETIDLVLSSLTLQWCSITEVFAEILRVLTPGGTALLSTLGPQSLREFRAAWALADAQVHGNDFIALPLIEEAARQTGLLVASEEEVITRYYTSLLQLSQELKGLGANVVLARESQALTTRRQFNAASAAFARHRQEQGIPVSWQVFYLTLHKPAGSVHDN